MSAPEVVLNDERSRFELEDEGATAFLEFERSGDTLTLVHTDVPERLEGHGVGTKLVRFAISYVKDNGLKVVPKCPFVASYLKRHPDEAKTLGLDPASL
jgi:predicted GNAT family acetyltransferase